VVGRLFVERKASPCGTRTANTAGRIPGCDPVLVRPTAGHRRSWWPAPRSGSQGGYPAATTQGGEPPRPPLAQRAPAPGRKVSPAAPPGAGLLSQAGQCEETPHVPDAVTFGRHKPAPAHRRQPQPAHPRPRCRMSSPLPPPRPVAGAGGCGRGHHQGGERGQHPEHRRCPEPTCAGLKNSSPSSASASPPHTPEAFERVIRPRTRARTRIASGPWRPPPAKTRHPERG